jgi:hypothetical protein
MSRVMRSPTSVTLAVAALASISLLSPSAWGSPRPDTPTRASSSPPLLLAQAGSTGGTIGKQGKSVSGGEDARPSRRIGERERPRRADREKPRRARQAARNVAEPRTVAGSTANYDGSWTVTSAPNESSCGFPVTMNVSVSGGTVSGPGLRGRVDRGGGVHATWQLGRLRSDFSGRVSGSGGSGTWRGIDNCRGRWRASRS